MQTAVRTVAIVAVALLLMSASIAGAADVKVELKAQNNSGENGSATLSDAGTGKTKVTVNVTGAPATAQPMHIHKGTCTKLDPKPAHPLPNLTAGKAEVTLNVAMSDLQKEPHAINGHKSAQEASVYVFCGEIPAK
jgi:Cu/Zn superoxide dismutase